MNYKWSKLGRVFVASKQADWMQEYAQVPTPVLLDDRIRVYYATRGLPDSNGEYVSQVSFIDVDMDNPTRLLYVHNERVILPGGLGAFDQYGVMPSAVIRMGGELWMYYIGWSRARVVPWHASIGLAISKDNGWTFSKYGEGPLISRSPNEPYMQGSPTLVHQDNLWHLYYLSGIRWDVHDGRHEAIYRLMHATSLNGLDWIRDGRQCIEHYHDDECQARPAVLIDEEGMHMWFSYRRGVDFRNPERGYRIGYAISKDGVNWDRRDERAGIDRSGAGWDSEMISYPGLLTLKDRHYLFYCGNQMGRDGFGVAVSVSAD